MNEKRIFFLGGRKAVADFNGFTVAAGNAPRAK